MFGFYKIIVGSKIVGELVWLIIGMDRFVM